MGVNILDFNGKCPLCGKEIDVSNEFRDSLSIKEYFISGLCQKCQDIGFAPPDESANEDVKEEHPEVSLEENIEKVKTVLEFKKDNYRGNVFHPTQKPVKLLEYLIKTYTNEGEVVLDNTMGSGSTGVACMNTERKFIGIELDKNYFNIATKRITQ